MKSPILPSANPCTSPSAHAIIFGIERGGVSSLPSRTPSLALWQTNRIEVELVSFEVPPWVRDAVFYQIFPGRFAVSTRVPKPPNLEPWDVSPTFHGFKGGDLLGVVERLDYLVDLGINAL